MRMRTRFDDFDASATMRTGSTVPDSLIRRHPYLRAIDQTVTHLPRGGKQYVGEPSLEVGG